MKYDIKYILRRVISALLIILILSFCKNCQVKALSNMSAAGGVALEDFTTYNGAVSFTGSGSNSYSSLTLLRNNNYNVNYVNSFATGTYGGGFFGFTNYTFFPNHVYNVTYATSQPSVGCDFGSGYDAHFKINNGISQSTRATISKKYVTNNYVQYYTGEQLYACIYTVTFTVSEQSSFMLLPFDSNGSFTGAWWFAGYNIQDFGRTDELSSNDISNQTTAIQNAISSSTTNITNSITNSTNSINNNLNDIEGAITDDNVSGANSQVDSLLNNSAFQDNTGLTAIISTPLNFISSLNNTCSPINLTLPYFKNNTQLTLPCISSLLQDKIPTVKTLLSTVINGFIVYRILIDLFYIVKSARNPEDDRIEVLDL